MLNPYVIWHSYFLRPWQSLYEERVKSLEKILPSSGNAILSISLKYQEIDVQNKPSRTKIETSYVVALLTSTNCRFVDYKHWK